MWKCIFSLFRQWSRHVEMCFSLKSLLIKRGTVFVYDVLRPTRSCFRVVKGNWNVGRTLTGFYWGTNIHDHCEKIQCLRELVCAILFLNCTKRAQTGNWVSPLIQMSLPYHVISATEEVQYDFYHLYLLSIYRNSCQAVKIQSIRLQVPLYNQARYQWITSSHGSFTAKSIAWVQKNWLKKTFDVNAPWGALGVTSMCHGRAPWVRHSKVIKKRHLSHGPPATHWRHSKKLSAAPKNQFFHWFF